MRQRKERERNFDTRGGFVDLFVEMGFNNAIVVEAKPFAERILGDLEAAVEVTPQGGRKKESDGERERSRL